MESGMTFVSSARTRLSHAELEVFTHPIGLRHLHLHDTSATPTFMIAFPTPPECSDGRAHVLEHMVMMGSQRFPVHSLFTRLQERSLASSMNAMTGEMGTCYPFASPHLDDYAQVLDVYLDIVFHPRLQRADFLAEGFRWHRTPEDTIAFQGVVFNEMTGAAEDPDHHAYAALRQLLYPHSPLGRESGGDPLAMTTLTHEQVIALHQQGYHPAHAVVLTAGPEVVVAVTQAALAPLLAEPWPAPPALPAMPTRTWQGTQRHTVRLPSQEDGEQWLVAWPLGSELDGDGLDAWVRMRLFHAMWLDESSPFMQAYQAQQWGRLGSLSGVQTMGLDQWLILHFQGLAHDDVAAVEALVRDHAARLATEGLPDTLLQRHRRDVDIELRRRSEAGPEGALNRFFEVLNPLLYVPTLAPQTVAHLLDAHVGQAQWTHALTDPAFVRRLAHTVTQPVAELVMTGLTDDQFDAQRSQRLEALQTAATEAWTHSADFQADVRADEGLLAHHAEEAGSSDLLPVFPVDRIPRMAPARPVVTPVAPGLLWVPADQHGLAQVTLMADLSGLSPATFNALSALFNVLLPGMGDRHGSWPEAIVRRQEAGTEVMGWVRADVTQAGTPVLTGLVQGLTRAEDAPALANALVDLVQTPDWADVARVTYLVQSECDAMQERMLSMGDQWMSAQLAQGLHRSGDWQHEVLGLPRVHFWTQLADQLEQDPAAALATLHDAWRQLAHAPWQVAIVGAATAQAAGHLACQRLQAAGWTLANGASMAPSLGELRPQRTVLVSPQRTSGYHGMAWLAPATQDSATADLALLGQLLTQEELLPRVRGKGGAYGSQAAWERGVFHMSSWNDPRLTGTLKDFEATRQRALRPFSAEQLAHAQRLLFQQMDSPRKPMKLGNLVLQAHWRGDQPADRQRWREALLSATPARVAATAATWLSGPAINTVAFTDRRHQAEAERLGLTPLPLVAED